MTHPPLKLSIVIPTRERADTLASTLRTVVAQDYSNLQIIVTDNFSNGETRDVVASFGDRRIEYTNTGKRIGMSSNWEHGLGLVTGDYVMFLGDDDGMMPSACGDVARVIAVTGTPAVIWVKADYSWPCSFAAPNQLGVVLENRLMEIPSRLVLAGLAWGLTGYGRLPVIYSGFVSMQAVNRVREKTKRFFLSVTPDIYSGIVIAAEIDSYLYSTRPFSLNGGSRHSNGQASYAPKGLMGTFFDEADVPVHRKISIIPGSVASYEAEAFCQAEDRGLTRSWKLRESVYYRKIFDDLNRTNGELAVSGLRTLMTFDLPRSLARRVSLCLAQKEEERLGEGQATADAEVLERPAFVKKLDIEADAFDVRDVYGACTLVHRLIGGYEMPARVQRVGLGTLAMTKLFRVAMGGLRRHVLPL